MAFCAAANHRAGGCATPRYRLLSHNFTTSPALFEFLKALTYRDYVGGDEIFSGKFMLSSDFCSHRIHI